MSAGGQWTVDAVPEQIGEVRRAVVACAHELGTPEPPLTDLQLVVSEAITNAVLHAYREGRPGTIDVSVATDPARDRVVVRVRDHGVGMSPREDSPGAGMGLPLIAAITDEFEVTAPADGGTEVVMSFALHR